VTALRPRLRQIVIPAKAGIQAIKRSEGHPSARESASRNIGKRSWNHANRDAVRDPSPTLPCRQGREPRKEAA